MKPHPIRLGLIVLAVSLSVSHGRALAAGPDAQPPAGEVASSPAGPKINFTVLGGLSVPTCGNQQGCDGDLGAGPSLGGLVLYAPTEKWAFGVAVQVSKAHWRQPYIGMVDGKQYQIESDLKSGFAAVAARYVPLPALRVTPIFQAALGTAFQSQTGDNFNCNGGFIPTGQLGAGGRIRASTAFSLFALASATWGFNLEQCYVSDGPGTTPFAGWGVGLHAGAAFDLAI